MLRFLARNWFPLALGGIFLLSVPALVLCLLNIAFTSGRVNEWLQENMALTFHPELPPFALILVLLLPLILLILYFLKLKRKPLQVPSTYLWKKSLEDLHVNSLLQWLRKNVLLILQLLILVTLIYSVLGIRFHAGTTRGKYYVLLIDNSASMNAKDLDMSRLDWAKQEAIKIINSKGDDDSGMVIAFNSTASLLTGYTRDRAKLRDAVHRIQPTFRKSRVEEALLLAESQSNQVRAIENYASLPADIPPDQERTMVEAKGVLAEVHLLSDGRFPLDQSTLDRLKARETGSTNPLGNLSLRYHPVGKSGVKGVNNLGIVALDAVRKTFDRAKVDRFSAQRLQVLARVRNFRNTPVSKADKVFFKLDLYVDGELVRPMQQHLEIEKRTVEVKAGEVDPQDEPGEATLDFDLPPMNLKRTIVLHAYLDGHKDDFKSDDQAWFVVGSGRPARVVIAGGRNPVLDAFFEQEGIAQLAEVTRLSPEDLDTDKYLTLAREGKVDLFVFDRCTPRNEESMPLGNTVFIDRVPPPWLRSTKKIEGPQALISDRKHPLLQYITTLGDAGFAEAFLFDLKNDLEEKTKAEFSESGKGTAKRYWPGTKVLVEAKGNVPLILSMNRGPYQDVILTFSLVNARGDLFTTWPLQPSFPLFWRNILYELGNVEDSVRVPTSEAGSTLVLRPEAKVQSLKIVRPDGSSDALDREKRPYFAYKETEQLGLYRVERDDGLNRAFAVNLLDAEESNIEPVPHLKVGSKLITGEGEKATPWELWKWILVIGFSLLVVEWIIYNKRVAL